MKWTTREIKYLEDHADDGATAIADALGRSVRSVESQARRFGLSLRRAWQCSKCGRRVHTPLSSRTGWCVACTRELRNERIAEEVRELQEEVRREEAINRERQRLYSAKHRAKKKLKNMRK